MWSTAREAASTNPRLSLDLGFSYRDGTTGKSHRIAPDGRTVLRSGKDYYQIFFRPGQSCYVYLLQRDTAGKWFVLFPNSDTATNPVEKGKDYWIPSFDKGFPGDGSVGEEQLYVVASMSEMKNLQGPNPEIDGTTLSVARSFHTRGLSHIGKLEPPQTAGKPGFKPTGAKRTTASYGNMIDHYESEEGLVHKVSFILR